MKSHGSVISSEEEKEKIPEKIGELNVLPDEALISAITCLKGDGEKLRTKNAVLWERLENRYGEWVKLNKKFSLPNASFFQIEVFLESYIFIGAAAGGIISQLTEFNIIPINPPDLSSQIVVFIAFQIIGIISGWLAAYNVRKANEKLKQPHFLSSSLEMLVEELIQRNRNSINGILEKIPKGLGEEKKLDWKVFVKEKLPLLRFPACISKEIFDDHFQKLKKSIQLLEELQEKDFYNEPAQPATTEIPCEKTALIKKDTHKQKKPGAFNLENYIRTFLGAMACSLGLWASIRGMILAKNDNYEDSLRGNVSAATVLSVTTFAGLGLSFWQYCLNAKKKKYLAAAEKQKLMTEKAEKIHQLEESCYQNLEFLMALNSVSLR